MSRARSMKELLQAARQTRRHDTNTSPAQAARAGTTSAAITPSVASPCLSSSQRAELAAYSTRSFVPSTTAPAVHLLEQHALAAVPSPPPAAYIIPEFVSEEESMQLLSLIASSPACAWHQLKRRRLQMWGGLPGDPAFTPDPLPAWQEQIIDRVCSGVVTSASSLAGTGSGSGSAVSLFSPDLRPNHVLLNSYEAGEGIMPHQDGPLYEPRVAILSLGSHTVMNFYSSLADSLPSSHRPAFSVLLPPRSLLIFLDQLYTHYFHSIDERTSDEMSAAVINAPPESVGRTIERATRISLTIRRVRDQTHAAAALKPLEPQQDAGTR